MTAINDRLNAVAEFGDVVPACVVSLCGDASTEIARLQAQVDALTKAGEQALAWMESAWDRIDGEWGPCGRTLDEECEEGREPEIAGLRAALTADVTSSTH